jgi:hypothetical protein
VTVIAAVVAVAVAAAAVVVVVVVVAARTSEDMFPVDQILVHPPGDTGPAPELL